MCLKDLLQPRSGLFSTAWAVCTVAYPIIKFEFGKGYEVGEFQARHYNWIMQKYRVIEKKLGETPLQALEVFRNTKSVLANLPLTYAGRLDPMASGKLLILIGDECKKRKLYDGLDKEYEFEVLFGFKTDTGDVLGIAESCGEVSDFSFGAIRRVIKSFVGNQKLPYPAFSSKTVEGVPLFHHALSNNLEEIEVPKADTMIYRMSFSGMHTVSGEALIQNILEKINLLQVAPPDSRLGSGFRKEEIIARWRSFTESRSRQYVVVKCKAVVSSGTYIRSIAPLTAEKLGTCGLAYSIHRTKIGRYFPITKDFGFWTKTF